MTVTRPPTMKDVAAAAGVSLKTVSRHVNGATNIHPGLAERIRAAIAELGYRPNLAAASLRPGRSGMVIGLVIGDLANPYYSTLARAIERACDDRGYLLVTASSEEEGARFDRLVERLVAQRVDGLIVVPPREAGQALTGQARHLPPVVFLDRPGPEDGPAAAAVLADNAGGARSATAELVRHGARRIAFLGDSLALPTMRERYAGYRMALEEAGLAVGAGPVSTDAHTAEQAARIVTGMLTAGSADAVFAANNRASVGAVTAFARAGRRVPLFGFDDFEAAPLLDPPVSVVSQDIDEMGRVAADELLSALQRGAAPRAAQRILPTRLLLRGSERPARDSVAAAGPGASA